MGAHSREHQRRRQVVTRFVTLRRRRFVSPDILVETTPKIVTLPPCSCQLLGHGTVSAP